MTNVGRFGWSLRAGFCIYDCLQIRAVPLNFLNNFPLGLDTARRNWECLYSRHDPRTLKFADWRLFDVMDEPDSVPRQLEIIDGLWMHIGGASYHNRYQKNATFSIRILEPIDVGANWDQLRSEMEAAATRPPPVEIITKIGRNRRQKPSFNRWHTRASLGNRLRGAIEDLNSRRATIGRVRDGRVLGDERYQTGRQALLITLGETRTVAGQRVLAPSGVLLMCTQNRFSKEKLNPQNHTVS